jgi:hypothetical protein
VSKAKNSKEIILRISEEQHENLIWLSQKLGLSVSDTLRGLIPIYQRPSGRIVDEKDVGKAGPEDCIRLPVKFDTARLKRLLGQLRNTGAAVTLCSELELELLEKQTPYLSFPVYKRLSRWISPRRWTAREKKVKPLAESISKLVFGKVIQRVM